MSESNPTTSARSPITCKQCGKPVFSCPSKQRIFCSNVCSVLARRNRKTSVCLQCGASFEDKVSAFTRFARKHCSRACAIASTPKVVCLCTTCGVEFKVHQCRFRVRSTAGKYCSTTCSGIASRTATTRTCRTCNAEFQFMPSQAKYYKGAGKYCSRKCSYAGTVKATASKPITDRYGRTGRKADKDWKEAVRLKDNFTCQRCGTYDKHIHTHHVAPRSRRPDLRHVVSNGKCLCPLCHLWTHHHPLEATAMGLLSDASYERARREKTFCRICGEKNAGHGYCTKHYKRWRKYGDPLLTKRHGGNNDIVPFRVSQEASMR